MAYISHPPSLLRTHAHNLPRPPLTFPPASPSRLTRCRPPRHRLALTKHNHLSFLNVHRLFSVYLSRSPLAVGTCASIEPALLCSTQPEQVWSFPTLSHVTCLCLPSPDPRLALTVYSVICRRSPLFRRLASPRHHTPTRCLCPPG